MITAKKELLDVPISDLTPYERNPRKNDKAVKKVAASLERFGLVKNSVVVDEDMVLITGHTTLKAMQSLGWTACPAVTQVYGLTEEEKRAYRIADNKLGELAEWDLDLLAGELASLDEVGFDVELTGFDTDALAELVPPEKLEVAEDDYEPPVEIETNIQRGDLFRLGRHRLLCGDSTRAEDVGRLMDGRKADLCMTDPPYGADIQYATHDDTQDALVGLIAGFFPLAEKYSDVIALTPGIANIWHYKKADWVLCWFYAAGTGSTPWGFSAWQPVLVWGKDPKLATGEGRHPDGFQYMMSRDDAQENKCLGHACPKPLSVWRRFIERLSNKKTELIYDPFTGSGTTLIACEQLGLTCYGMEISPQYCQVIIDRWEKLTGQKAEKVDA